MRCGIDVGGTKVALSLVTEGGEALASSTFATPKPARPEELMAMLAQNVESLLAEVGAELPRLEAVGMGFPADFETTTGIVLTAPNLPLFVGLDPHRLLVHALRRRLGYRGTVALGNDACAAALAEARWGAGRGCGSFLYLTVSTGIGGARLEQAGGTARAVNIEPGKNTFPDPRWPDLCLDRLASGAALARRVGEELTALLETGGLSALEERTRLFATPELSPRRVAQRVKAVAARDLSRAAAAGDDYSRRWLAHSANLVAVSLGQLAVEASSNGRPLRRIIVGGSIALKAPGYLEKLRQGFHARLPPTPDGEKKREECLVAAELGDDRGSLGATLLPALLPETSAT